MSFIGHDIAMGLVPPSSDGHQKSLDNLTAIMSNEKDMLIKSNNYSSPSVSKKFNSRNDQITESGEKKGSSIKFAGLPGSGNDK